MADYDDKRELDQTNQSDDTGSMPSDQTKQSDQSGGYDNPDARKQIHDRRTDDNSLWDE